MFPFSPTGGAERTVIEHLIRRIDIVLSAKTVTMHILHYRPLSASVFDNCPASYLAVLLDFGLSQVETVVTAANESR